MQRLTITLPTPMTDAIRAKVASGEYATESDVIVAGVRLLLVQDRVTEYWLRTEVAAAYDAIQADPARGLDVGQVRADLADARRRHVDKSRL